MKIWELFRCNIDFYSVLSLFTPISVPLIMLGCLFTKDSQVAGTEQEIGLWRLHFWTWLCHLLFEWLLRLVTEPPWARFSSYLSCLPHQGEYLETLIPPPPHTHTSSLIMSAHIQDKSFNLRTLFLRVGVSNTISPILLLSLNSLELRMPSPYCKKI